MFSQASVILFTGCGEGACMAGEAVADPGGVPRGHGPPSPVQTSHKKDGRQRQPHRFHVYWPPLTRPLDPMLGEGMHSRWGGHAWQGGIRGRRNGHCSGRYASYWNALLLLHEITRVQFDLKALEMTIHLETMEKCWNFVNFNKNPGKMV